MKLLHVAAIAAAVAVPVIGAGAQEQRVKLTPIATDAALVEFARVCLRTSPSAGKVREAVGKSALTYQPVEAAAGQQWRSPEAVVALVAQDGKAKKCEFDAMLIDKIEPGVLAGKVQNRLERELGNRPPYHQVGQTIVWEWSFGAVTRKLTIDFTGVERQLALSLSLSSA